MVNQNFKPLLAVAVILLGGLGILFYKPNSGQKNAANTASGNSVVESSGTGHKSSDDINAKIQDGSGNPRPSSQETGIDKKSVTANQIMTSDFPMNDKIELPFIGAVPCHAKVEQVEFEGKGKRLKWPFKLYYLANGMFVRAEFVKAGAIMYDEKTKDVVKPDATIIYEAKPKDLESGYRVRSEKLVGLPEKAAPASLSVVLKYLYDNEPFDDATKIDITWVLRKYRDEEIKPCFIANIYGVSVGGMFRVPQDDETFKRYRILLTPEGVGFQQDNLL